MARSAFVLETSGGNYVTVQSPEHIKLPPKGFDLVVVFGTDGLVRCVQKDYGGEGCGVGCCCEVLLVLRSSISSVALL